MSETQQLEISNQECHMLNMIRGLHQDVFYMVVAAEKTDLGYILKGTAVDFANLRHDMYDELELKPRSRTVHSLLRKLETITEEVW